MFHFSVSVCCCNDREQVGFWKSCDWPGPLSQSVLLAALEDGQHELVSGDEGWTGHGGLLKPSDSLTPSTNRAAALKGCFRDPETQAY